MSKLQEYEGYVRKRIAEDGISHNELSEELKRLDAQSIGFSVRSIKRFCQENGIHKVTNISQSQVEEAVTAGVAMVRKGPYM